MAMARVSLQKAAHLQMPRHRGVCGSPAKVGFVIGSMMRGGAEMHLAQVLPELKARGWSVSVFVLGPTGPVADLLRGAGVQVFPEQPVTVPDWLPSWPRRLLRLVMLAPKFRGFLRRHEGGVIHYFLPEALIIGGILSFPWKIPFVASRRGLAKYRDKYPSVVATIERYLQRRAVFLIGNSRRVTDEIRSDSIPPERIRLIYNGLTPERLDAPGATRDAMRSKLAIPGDSLVLVVVANLIPYKGHADLIDALGLAAKDSRMPDRWKLLLVGRDASLAGSRPIDGPSKTMRGALVKKIEAHGIQSKVSFLGERDDAVEILRCADIGILASHEEGFSNSLIEKMAAGLGVIATDVGGNREALDDGTAGILVPAQRPDALARAIVTLASDPALRAALGKKARACATRRYQIDSCVDAYEDLYRDVLDWSVGLSRERAAP